MAEKYDFGGWATRFNILCGDGRTIRKGAFDDCDNTTVPLVWNHQHNSPLNVLGHAFLQNRDDGVYAYCTFNNTPQGANAKELVKNGDISALSIFANQLKQKGGDVLHGTIREVSMVLAGANPGAYIDSSMAHGFETDDEAVIYNDDDEDMQIYEDDEYEDDAEYEEEYDDDEINHSYEGEDEMRDEMYFAHADDDVEDEDSGEETVQDVFDTLNEKQKKVVYYMIGEAVKGNGGNEELEDDEEMKHNVFDQDYSDSLQHSMITLDEQRTIIDDMKRFGSLRESFLAHKEDMGIEDVLMHDDTSAGIERSLPVGGTGAQDYFVTEPSFLFPDAKYLNETPGWIKRRTEWVSSVINGTKHTPFSRVKTLFADITNDEARAKGYTKAHEKIEEVFTLLKRTTTPTTIYKKQKMDRDDVVDITTFDVIAWIRGEMRMMLEEELARAILIGDGRLGSSDDKINEQNIRPIWTDDDLFTIKALVTFAANATDDDKAKALIKAAVKARKNYQGSGNPVLFTTEDNLTNMLLLEDAMGYRLYKSEQELASAMRVSKIITVQVMENQTRTDSDSKTRTLEGLIVNLSDYTVGADKGGAVSMFDDFDIDVNQQKYLIETRCSGALTVPYSAIALESTTAS